MQDERSQQVTARFLQAIAQLKADGIVRGKQTVCRKLEINRRHLWILEQNPCSDILKLRWLTDMVTVYGISARWLLTGEGNVYAAKKVGEK